MLGPIFKASIFWMSRPDTSFPLLFSNSCRQTQHFKFFIRYRDFRQLRELPSTYSLGWSSNPILSD
jgi:hypothetical protein